MTKRTHNRNYRIEARERNVSNPSFLFTVLRRIIPDSISRRRSISDLKQHKKKRINITRSDEEQEQLKLLKLLKRASRIENRWTFESSISICRKVSISVLKKDKSHSIKITWSDEETGKRWHCGAWRFFRRDNCLFVFVVLNFQVNLWLRCPGLFTVHIVGLCLTNIWLWVSNSQLIVTNSKANYIWLWVSNSQLIKTNSKANLKPTRPVIGFYSQSASKLHKGVSSG